MKEWLRQHPEQVPAGLDPNISTSHQLRNALRKRGWQVQESASEVRLVMPGGLKEGLKLKRFLAKPETKLRMTSGKRRRIATLRPGRGLPCRCEPRPAPARRLAWIQNCGGRLQPAVIRTLFATWTQKDHHEVTKGTKALWVGSSWASSLRS
jgi:hypothetical protein